MEYIADTFMKPETFSGANGEDWSTCTCSHITINNGAITSISVPLVGSMVSDDTQKELINLQQGVNDIRMILETQKDDGNWNSDIYQLGIYNGLVLALSCVDEKYQWMTELRHCPDKWLSENEINESDSLQDRLLKVSTEWYRNHAGEVCPSAVTINFLNDRINLVHNQEITTKFVFDNMTTTFDEIVNA